MEEILATLELGQGRNLHIAQLSRQTILDADAAHLGFGGYYLFETVESCLVNGINVLCKAVSLDAAFRLADIMGANRPA
ncbi:hypothetical protein [Agrobacterium radiobacter]|uniref:hypothetical protein n=1 Tax=Agrobacterium radiobacter TaxID=362 RepID=UPI001606918E|nr:hypothetical protein [Agrobacterium radiobacter]MBB4407082.1 hypothetical protein [Agrobacterium radiobacter]MBB4452714.1 hypothetical protein [Agrobacterium radiobacter]